MGRKRKFRRVAGLPEVTVFKPQGVPLGRLYGVALGLDEFEALRLVDAQGLSQEEAAQAMGVSRPTLCRILGEARTKVARALAQGWAIRIETGQLGTVQQETVPHPDQGDNPALDAERNQGEESCSEQEINADKACVADGGTI